jgi:hypothetical protein
LHHNGYPRDDIGLNPACTKNPRTRPLPLELGRKKKSKKKKTESKEKVFSYMTKSGTIQTTGMRGWRWERPPETVAASKPGWQRMGGGL